MEGKHFRIKKDFEIKKEPTHQPPSVKGKGRFEIKKESEEQPFQMSGDWHRQANDNDCGPCMILNISSALGLSIPDTTIQEVRDHVNGTRREQRNEPLDSQQNLLSGDVGDYLANVMKLNVEDYPCVEYEPDKILRKIHESINTRSPMLIYSTRGRHFRAIVWDTSAPDQPILLDSFSSGPQSVTPNGVENFIHDTVYGSKKGRVEHFGIVRHGGPRFRSM